MKINKLGEILIQKKYITQKQLDEALKKKTKKPIGEVLIKMGHVTEKEIAQALTDQTIAQKIQENLSSAVKNPGQHKVLWFIVVFSIIGIGFIWTSLGGVDEGREENFRKNTVQDEDINATKVGTKKTRLKYIGHDSKLSEQRDTIKSMKSNISLFKSDVASEFKYTETEIEDLRVFSFEEDSILKEELSDLDDRFFTYRSTSKNDINRLKKENKALKARIDDLEKMLISLKETLKEEESE